MSSLAAAAADAAAALQVGGGNALGGAKNNVHDLIDYEGISEA